MSESAYSWMEPYPTPDVERVPRPMDWSGYTVAALLGWIVFALIGSLPLVFFAAWGLGPLAPLVLVVTVPALIVGCATYGFPATVLGILVVRTIERRTSGEFAPILIAGLVGGALSALWVQLLSSLGYLPSFLPTVSELWVGPIAGFATAVGYGWTVSRIGFEEL